jgi:hypothetical protein
LDQSHFEILLTAIVAFSCKGDKRNFSGGKAEKIARLFQTNSID